MISIFLSHSSVDKSLVRDIQARLTFVGVEAFFDEVSIANGDSIPGRIDEALSATDRFVLFWSKSAADSPWVTTEREAATHIFQGRPEPSFIVVALDKTELPTTLRHKKYIEGSGGDAQLIADEIMDFKRPAQRIIALQQVLETLDIQVDYIPGYGACVGCPNCGAGLSDLKGYEEIDYERDDVYRGFTCTLCGHTDGGEV